MQRHVLAARCAALLFALGGTARAGNLDSFAQGNEAALTAGAVVAVTHDASAAWYNPAGLGALERDSIDGSATALNYRAYDLPRALRVRFPHDEKTADVTSSVTFSVPVSLVIGRHLGDRFSAALGIFVQRQENISGRGAVTVDGPAGAYHYQTAFGVVQQLTTYYVGPAFGYAVTKDLRVGAALFATYTTVQTFFDFGSTLATSDGGSATGVLERHATITVLGARPTAGIQWSPANAWDVGLMVRAPNLALAGSERITGIDQATTISHGSSQSELTLPDSRPSGSLFQAIEPTRVHVGFARTFRQGWIGMSADYAFAQTNPDGTPKTAAVTNVQVGGRAWLSNHVGLGAGLFTDRSSTPTSFTRDVNVDSIDHLATSRVNFVGATAGIEYRRRYDVVGNAATPSAPAPPTRGLEFATTVALRYARGRGTIQGALIEPLTSPPNGYREITTDATVHEFTVHVGTALYF